MSGRRIFGVALLCLLAFWGCGSGDKTDIEKGKEALDNREWTTAIAIFEDMPVSAERNKYLSSAYAGAAGLDLLELAVQVSEAQDNGGNATSVVWQVAASLLPPVDGKVTLTELQQKVDYLIAAIDVHVEGYASLPVTDFTTVDFSDEQKIQLGLEAIFLVQYKMMLDLVPFDDPTRSFVEPCALSSHLAANPTDIDNMLNNTAGNLLDNSVSLTKLGLDTITELNPSGNDLATELSNFLDLIGYPGTIDRPKLVAYIIAIMDGAGCPFSI
jgi:hypothetical protein